MPLIFWREQETAKKVLINLSDYLADVIAPLSEEQMQTMLNCEYGGMNEAFAQVYALTGDKKYLDASYAFIISVCKIN